MDLLQNRDGAGRLGAIGLVGGDGGRQGGSVQGTAVSSWIGGDGLEGTER